VSEPDFSRLATEFQTVLRIAQEQHNIQVVPLAELKGGRTGARLFLVSVSSESPGIAHYVLKVDRVPKRAKADEIEKHRTAADQAPPEFARRHMADVAFEVKHQGAIAVFYTIAGQSLHQYSPLAAFSGQGRLEAIFRETNRQILEKWNAELTFVQSIHPRQLLVKWLGYRLKPGGNIGSFLEEEFGVGQETAGLLIDGQLYPNPLVYGRESERWGNSRAIDAAFGFQHGDLNIGNILVRFDGSQDRIDGFYLIDFALFKNQMPLFYDQRYLEMSYLIRELGRSNFHSWVQLVSQFAQEDVPEPGQVPAELAGVCGVINAGRNDFAHWVRDAHPSLSDDLWGQFWLAATAAGLNYCNKAAIPTEERLAGFIFAASHLKRYLSQFDAPMPVDASHLYDPGHVRPVKRATRIRSRAESPSLNLPIQPTRFIGRQMEVAAVGKLLMADGVRLITLIGPGGTGKTRLGLQVASQWAGRFDDGVFFVPLADVTDPDFVMPTIAKTLGLREGGSHSLLQNMKAFLSDRQTLLLLDNFEQVIEAAPTLADLLASAPSLKLLVTSRRLLNLQGEHEFFVPPLKLPQSDESGTVEQFSETEAVQLFLERGKAANSRFELARENANIIAQICIRLDGLPLAIELAAARIRLLTPEAILGRLSDRLALLSGGARDLPVRQQALRNTIDWSYDLLNDDEKILFRRLSVFVGGFTLEAAESVCNFRGVLDVLSALESLINSSLIRQEEGGSDLPRFRMLETIREYALERLEEQEESGEILTQHAYYYVRQMAEVTGKSWLYSSESNTWLDWIEREYDNLRAVLSMTKHDPESMWQALVLITAMYWFWYRRGYFSEGRQWTEWALTTPAAEGASQIRGYGLLLNGIMAMWQGELTTAVSLIDESSHIWFSLEEDQGVALAFLFKGFVLLNQGEDAAAKPQLEQALGLFKSMDQPWQVADTSVHLANAALGVGNVDEALSQLDEAKTISQKVGDDWLIALVLNNYGEVARVQGDHGRAGRFYEECEQLLRSAGDKGGDLARIVHNMGYVAQHQGQMERAESLFHESLYMFRKLANKRGIIECLAALAGLMARQSSPEKGAELLSAAERFMTDAGQAFWPADRLEVENNWQFIRASLDDEILSPAREKGRKWTLRNPDSWINQVFHRNLVTPCPEWSSL
jgi:predicted ATPase/Tfp pilus assembly protein PilF